MNEIKPVMSMFANELDCLRARDQWLHARISTLERELAESKAREARLSAHIQEAADRAHIRSLTNTHYGKWLASLRDWHLAALQQKGDTNADV